jgi:hypothetical protein
MNSNSATTPRKRHKRFVLVSAAAALAAMGAAAQPAAASDEIAWGRVSWLGPRGVEVAALVTDTPGDPYCTSVTATVHNVHGYQLGNVINLGSVCGGRTSWTELKTIRTTAGDIYKVVLRAQRGTGGPFVDQLTITR